MKIIANLKQKQRVDIYLSTLFQDKSRSYIQRLIDSWEIQINWAVINKNVKINDEDEIEINFKTEKLDLKAEKIPLHIVYEDKNFAIINKDAGLNTHPVPGEKWKSGTLVNALLYHLKDLSFINWVERPGIVHRLDKDTSGLLIIAKNDKYMREFQRLIAERKIKKTYIALVNWIIKEKEWFIESYIWRDKFNRQKMTTKDPINPKLAQTKFKVLDYIDNKFSLLEVELLTWRTHQIRVHLSSIGFPIVWDKIYGNKKINDEFFGKYSLNRQYLHAYKLEFTIFWNEYKFLWELKTDLRRVVFLRPVSI